MPIEPPDQRDLWIAAYANDQGANIQKSRFAEECLALLPPASRILELGCGPGADAEAFARAGHSVTATDFVPAVIAANRNRHADNPNLTFAEMRIDAPYPFANHAFDAVYAHLTLHYYRHDITTGILREIRRVLRPGGSLLFACKSPQDPAWGKGTELEPDMFDFHGKVRHFFSEDYARALLSDDFTEIQVTSHTGKLYRQRAGWITVIAQRS
jgi:SAM-dependent methyltransferase